MNATRAATIRLRSSFDGAVSLGRVQTPTLAIIARREEEIRAFKPEPYWLVDARFEPSRGPGAPLRRPLPRRRQAAPRQRGRGAARSSPRARAGRRDHQGREARGDREAADALRPDLAAARRQHPLRLLRAAHARRRPAALRGAQGADLPAHQLALPDRPTWPARSSRPPSWSARGPSTATPRPTSPASTCCRSARVIDDSKVTDHHAIIPTRAEHPVEKMDDDDRRIYDMVVRRFLAAFHPEAVFENTRVETTVAGPRLPHARQGAAGARLARRLPRRGRGARGRARRPPTRTRATSDALPRLEQGEPSLTLEVESLAKETKPPRRYTDASLLGAMETAGKLVDDEELREAMKDSGIGTPATRAAIIERLIDVGYIERDGRALVATEKGLNVIRLLGEHAADLARPDRQLGAAARADRARRGLARAVHARHRRLRQGDRRGARRDAQGRPHPAREPRPLPGLRPRHRREPQGLLLLVARGSRLRLRDLEGQGRQAAAARGRARADRDRPHRPCR